jgi:hypothetical protein
MGIIKGHCCHIYKRLIERQLATLPIFASLNETNLRRSIQSILSGEMRKVVPGKGWYRGMWS